MRMMVVLLVLVKFESSLLLLGQIYSASLLCPVPERPGCPTAELAVLTDSSNLMMESVTDIKQAIIKVQ